MTLQLAEAVSVFVVHSDWPTTSTATGTFAFDLGDLYAAEPKPLLLRRCGERTDGPGRVSVS